MGSQRSDASGLPAAGDSSPPAPAEGPVSAEEKPTPQGAAAEGTSAALEDAQTVITRTPPALDRPLPRVPAGSPADVAAVLIGQQLGHFQLDALIGGGGMGAVFRAHDTRLDRRVAIKVLPRVGDDPDLLRRFRNEAQSAARLDHPNIARVYDVGQHEGWHYIVFEFIDGINLRDLVASDGVLSIDDAVYYIRQVAEALEHAHRRGVTHRDIKPSNLLITPGGQVKLVDMGLARSQQLEVSEDMTASGVTLGTFDYISPEQARDPRDAAVWSDIYSLGCTLYFALTGSPPYPGGTVLQKLLSHGSAPPPDPRRWRGDISEDLMAILLKMLAKQPADRYRRPVDLIADLYQLAEREGLRRSLSAGTITVAAGSGWPQLIDRHLPWLVAASLLLISTAWVHLLASAGSDLAIRAPEPLLPTNPAVPQEAGSDRGGTASSTIAALPGGLPLRPPTEEEATAFPLRVTEPEVPAGGEADAAEPPRFADLADSPSLPDPSSPVVDLPRSAPPEPVRIVAVGSPEGAATDGVLTADSLREALQLAAVEEQVQEIQLHRPVIRTGPLRLPRSGLRIRGADDYTQIVFDDQPVLAMERPVMFDLAEHGVEFEKLHFIWQVPTGAVEGGALFALAADQRSRVQLNDCTITVENLSQRDSVYAFEVQSDLPSRGADRAGAGLLPVALRMENCVARGQMSLIHMEVAAALQLSWQNGLLAVSRRLLESGGAIAPLAVPPRLKLRLEDITLSIPRGLARIRLGPSGRFPVALDRECINCVFTSQSDSVLVEILGLDDLTLAEQCLTLQGENNHYDMLDDHAELMYRAEARGGEVRSFGIAELLMTDYPWAQERSPQVAAVNWMGPIPPDNPPHSQGPKDYLQSGYILPGFDERRLPPMPRFVDPEEGFSPGSSPERI